jgi:hypothetical protein
MIEADRKALISISPFLPNTETTGDESNPALLQMFNNRSVHRYVLVSLPAQKAEYNAKEPWFVVICRQFELPLDDKVHVSLTLLSDLI